MSKIQEHAQDTLQALKSLKYNLKPIHHFRINRSLAGWAHSQRRVDVNITIPLH